MIAKIQENEIIPSDFPEDVGNKTGAIVMFEGIVRKYEGNKELSFLYYEAEQAMAEKELMKILMEAKARYAIQDAMAVHRIGRLMPGERSLLVKVASSHRKEGFEACLFIVDELKERVPIWKKDIYKDGTEQWH
ncbi:MAG: molybdenum cofactor biosynthesis protein MoaE [Thermoplasmatales archaeon]